MHERGNVSGDLTRPRDKAWRVFSVLHFHLLLLFTVDEVIQWKSAQEEISDLGGGPDIPWKGFDRDKDGKLSETETSAFAASMNR